MSLTSVVVIVVVVAAVAVVVVVVIAVLLCCFLSIRPSLRFCLLSILPFCQTRKAIKLTLVGERTRIHVARIHICRRLFNELSST